MFKKILKRKKDWPALLCVWVKNIKTNVLKNKHEEKIRIGQELYGYGHSSIEDAKNWNNAMKCKKQEKLHCLRLKNSITGLFKLN